MLCSFYCTKWQFYEAASESRDSAEVASPIQVVVGLPIRNTPSPLGHAVPCGLGEHNAHTRPYFYSLGHSEKPLNIHTDYDRCGIGGLSPLDFWVQVFLESCQSQILISSLIGIKMASQPVSDIRQAASSNRLLAMFKGPDRNSCFEETFQYTVRKEGRVIAI